MKALTLTLDQIVGRSPLNVRSEIGGDVSDLVASIPVVGVLQPLIVRDDGRGWEALSGGRRYEALCVLRDRGTIPTDYDVPVVFNDTDEAEAREISLAENLMRRALHPVEEFEAFSHLATSGLVVDKIAADFNVTARYVRQRLTLERLSQDVRDLWRKGKISAEAAAAYSTARSYAAQDAFLADPMKQGWQNDPRSIRQHFTQKTKPANGAEAVYVGLDAYAAAGGGVDDNLFQDFSLCLDGELLGRLARDKLQAAGEAIMDRHGYGFVMLGVDAQRYFDWPKLRQDFTPDEKARLAAIDADEAEAGDNAESVAVLVAEREALQERGIRRGATEAERATAGVIVEIAADGTLFADLGRVPPKADETARVVVNRKVPEPPEPEPHPEPAPTPKAEEERKPGKAIVECLDQARDTAFRSLIGERPDLAMLIATAVLCSGYNHSPLRFRAFVRSSAVPLIDSFAATLTELLGAANRDPLVLQTRFATAVGSTVLMNSNSRASVGDPTGITSPQDVTALADLVSGFCGGDTYQERMRDALDYEAYFKAAAREATLSAVLEAEGDNGHARSLKKAELAAYATELARDKGWLPRELRRPEALPADHPFATPIKSLADAMAEALQNDGEDEPAEEGNGPWVASGELDEPQEAGETGVFAVADFLTHECEREPGATTKAADLYAAYKARIARREPEVFTVQGFSTAATAFGIEKKRTAKGVLFLDVRVVAPAVEAA